MKWDELKGELVPIPLDDAPSVVINLVTKLTREESLTIERVREIMSAAGWTEEPSDAV